MRRISQAREKARQALCILFSVVLTCAMCPTAALAGDGEAGSNGSSSNTVYAQAPAASLSRIAGTDRYDTMRQVVAQGFSSADTVIVASGTNFPDALAASGLAGVMGAPVITTAPDSLSGDAREAIRLLGAAHAVILGGSGAVGIEVEEQLKNELGLSVSRVSGDDRYDTACEIYRSSQAGFGRVAVVTTGSNGSGGADALSAAPYIYQERAAVFLVDDSGDLSQGTSALLTAANFDEVVVLGGTARVSEGARESLKAIFGEEDVTELSGDTRYGTSSAIVKHMIDEELFSYDQLYIATGQNFADALASGSPAGKQCSGVLLVDDSEESHEVVDEIIGTNVGWLSRIVILGGTAAVSPDVEAAIRSLSDQAAGQVVGYKEGTIVFDGDAWTRVSPTKVAVDASASGTDAVEVGSIVVLDPNSENPGGLALKVTNVSRSGSTIVVEGTEPALDEVVNELDLSGATARIVSLTPEEGVTMASSDEGLSAFAVSDGTISIRKQSFTPFSGAKVTLDPYISYEIDYSWGKINSFDVAANFDMDFDFEWSASVSKEIKLATASFSTPVPGLAVDVDFYLVASAEGSVSIEAKLHTKAGVAYDDGEWDTYAKKKFSYEASFEAELSAGMKPVVAIEFLSIDLVDVSLCAEGVVDGVLAQHDTLVCCDLSAYMRIDAAVGEDSLAGDLGLKGTFHILTKENSPIWSIHTENGKLVDECTWGKVDDAYQLYLQQLQELDSAFESDQRLLMGSQWEMNVASVEYRERYDELVDEIYGYLLSVLSEEGVSSLEVEQAEWTAWKQAEMEAAALEGAGGTIAPLYINGAAIDCDRSRINELLGMLE